MRNNNSSWMIVIFIAIFALLSIFLQILILDNRTKPVDQEESTTAEMETNQEQPEN